MYEGTKGEALRVRTGSQVAVQLPMFNERAVCQAIIDSACEMHWPSDRFCVQVAPIAARLAASGQCCCQLAHLGASNIHWTDFLLAAWQLMGCSTAR